jgi:hypothetical protein
MSTLFQGIVASQNLFKPCYEGLLFVNFTVLNKNQVFRFWSLQVSLQTMKILQVKMLNVAVLMPLKGPLVMIAM